MVFHIKSVSRSDGCYEWVVIESRSIGISSHSTESFLARAPLRKSACRLINCSPSLFLPHNRCQVLPGKPAPQTPPVPSPSSLADGGI